MSLEPTSGQSPPSESAPASPSKPPLFRGWRLLALQGAVVASIGAGIWTLGGGAPFPTPWSSKAATVPYRTPSASTTGTASDFYALGPTGGFRGEGPGIGKPAPDFTLATPGGDVVRLSDFRGKIVVLNFWATWCPPCRKEFPELVKLYDPNGDVLVVGVDLQENSDQVGNFADKFGAKYPIVIDADAKVAGSYRVVGLPSTYFIDKDGVLRAQQFGQLSADILQKRIAKTRADSKGS